MRVLLYIAGFAVLLTTMGCEIEEHEHHGGYYGHREYERGHYQGYPGHYEWHDGYWDHGQYRYYR